MADNLNDDNLDNPTFPKTENFSHEITPTASLENINFTEQFYYAPLLKKCWKLISRCKSMMLSYKKKYRLINLLKFS